MTYDESVILACTPAVALAVLTVLFFLLRAILRLCVCLCIRCHACREPKDAKLYKERPGCAIWTFFVVAVIVVGGAIYGFIANQMITSGASQIQGALEDVDNMRQDNVNTANEVAANLTIIATCAKQLNSTFNEAEATSGNNVVVSQSVYNSLATMVSTSSAAQSAINSGVKAYENVPIDTAVQDIGKYNVYRQWAQVGVLVILLIPYIMVFFSVVCNLQWLVWHVTWVSVISSSLAWILTGAETSISILLADACMDPSGYILNQTASMSGVSDFVKYVVVCKDLQNPLQGQLDLATSSLNNATEYSATVESFLQTLSTQNISAPQLANLTTEIYNITNTTQATISTIDNTLNTVFKCNRLHNNYEKTIRGICDSALTGLAALVIIQGAMAFCAWIAIFAGIRLYRFLSHRKFQKSTDLTGLMFGKAPDPNQEEYEMGTQQSSNPKDIAL